MSQPTNVLSPYDAFQEITQVEWHAGHHKFVTDPWHGLIVKTDINRILEKLVVPLDDELKFAFGNRFGTNTNDWTELDLYQTMKLVTAQGASRFLVGHPLCKTLALWQNTQCRLLISTQVEMKNIFAT